jgi:hypothetical protein
MTFPSHFPKQCPPTTASQIRGEIFRFVSNKPPTADDFLSHYLLYGKDRFSADKVCQAHGLSVLLTEEDIKKARRIVPAFRKKHVAKGRPAADWGMLAQTEGRIPNHHTWWVGVGIFIDMLQSGGCLRGTH